MKPAVLLAAGAAVLVLAGCSDWEYTPPPPRSGTITELEHEPETSYEECGYDSVYNSRTQKYEQKYDCDTVYEDECWEVDYETPEGEEVEECIDEDMWVRLTVGMVYVENQSSLATATPWLTPSPSPSVSPSATASS